MKKLALSLIFMNLVLVLSACAAATSGDQNSHAPLSRHDRLWNPHLERW